MRLVSFYGCLQMRWGGLCVARIGICDDNRGNKGREMKVREFSECKGLWLLVGHALLVVFMYMCLYQAVFVLWSGGTRRCARGNRLSIG
jgi:hypothetical protein